MSKEIPESQKLHMLFRVEPGCMGPAGIDHINEFVDYANENIKRLNKPYVVWQIEARTNKKLPEIEYRVANKLLKEPQVEKYLSLFGSSVDTFEDEVNEHIALMVDEFWDADDSRGAG